MVLQAVTAETCLATTCCFRQGLLLHGAQGRLQTSNRRLRAPRFPKDYWRPSFLFLLKSNGGKNEGTHRRNSWLWTHPFFHIPEGPTVRTETKEGCAVRGWGVAHGEKEGADPSPAQRPVSTGATCTQQAGCSEIVTAASWSLAKGMMRCGSKCANKHRHAKRETSPTY